MIEIKFKNKVDKNKMFEALIKSAKKAENIPDSRLEITPLKVILLGCDDTKVFDECKYEETSNGIIFRTEPYGTLAEILYNKFPRVFRQDAYILFDKEIYFFSPNDFLEIKKGNVYMMQSDNMRKVVYQIRPENIRQDILDMIEYSKD